MRRNRPFGRVPTHYETATTKSSPCSGSAGSPRRQSRRKTDFIEHPDLVAERLVRYANLVGRENVLAGTDCGLGTRVGHPLICWGKFEAMAEGARRATKTLWGRA